MPDRNRPLKLEDQVGGSSTDLTPTETAPNSDGLDARAYFTQNDTSNDGSAYVSRTGSDLTLTDANAGTKAVQDLVSRSLGAVASHQALPHLAHFLSDGGPGDGWASGATMRVVRNGPLVASRTWYASAAPSAPPIVAISYQYKAGTPLPSVRTMTLYSTSGSVTRTCQDNFVWSGPLLTTVTRTWT